MGRILGFAVGAGTLTGGATGAVFTWFGIPFGLVIGAGLGLVAGLYMVGAMRFRADRMTLTGARLRLIPPPLVVLVLAAAFASYSDTGFGSDGLLLWVSGIAVAVAAPLIFWVMWSATPWCVAPAHPELADEFARPRMLRGLLAPFGVLTVALGSWIVYFIVTS